MNNWTEIADANLAANFHTLQAAANVEVLAVVKANGYGHGVERSATVLAGAGATWLGVTCASEGVRVRQALAQQPVRILLMCGFFLPDVPLLSQHNLTPAIWTPEQAAWLAGSPHPIHIEIDTGMSRQGARPGPELAALLEAVAAAGLQLEGVLTHFSSSEEDPAIKTLCQQRRFEAAVAQIAAAGHHPDWVHAGASSAIDNPTREPGWLADLAHSAGARPMVRTGIALYGCTLPLDPGVAPHVRPALQPVLTWKSRILSVRSLSPGDAVGYNATFTARAPMRVALLPVGFADGLRRELSSTNDRPGGWVMLHNRRAPILGRISMNLTIVDITNIPGVQPGDEAILLGPGIDADDHARLAQTTAYEILCGIHPCG